MSGYNRSRSSSSYRKPTYEYKSFKTAKERNQSSSKKKDDDMENFTDSFLAKFAKMKPEIKEDRSRGRSREQRNEGFYRNQTRNRHDQRRGRNQRDQSCGRIRTQRDKSRGRSRDRYSSKQPRSPSYNYGVSTPRSQRNFASYLTQKGTFSWKSGSRTPIRSNDVYRFNSRYDSRSPEESYRSGSRKHSRCNQYRSRSRSPSPIKRYSNAKRRLQSNDSYSRYGFLSSRSQSRSRSSSSRSSSPISRDESHIIYSPRSPNTPVINETQYSMESLPPKQEELSEDHALIQEIPEEKLNSVPAESLPNKVVKKEPEPIGSFIEKLTPTKKSTPTEKSIAIENSTGNILENALDPLNQFFYTFLPLSVANSKTLCEDSKLLNHPQFVATPTLNKYVCPPAFSMNTYPSFQQSNQGNNLHLVGGIDDETVSEIAMRIKEKELPKLATFQEATPCFEIRDSFDKNTMNRKNWQYNVRYDIARKCNSVNGEPLFVFVEKNSPNSVYVKCLSIEGAYRSAQFFHDEKKLIVNFIKLDQFYKRFPGSIGLTKIMV